MDQSDFPEAKPVSRYEAIMWEKEMKERILSQARAIYGESHPEGSVFDVVYATRTAAVTRNIHVKATRTYLIVYAFPNTHGSWKILEVIPPHDTVAERLDALLEKLNTNLTDLIEKKHEAQQIEQAKRDEHNAYCESRGMGHWVH